MISKFSIGKAFKTDAVINSNIASKKNIEYFPFIIKKKKSSFEIEIPLQNDSMVFGLNESLGNLNKRNRIIVSYNTDDPVHTPDKTSLYNSIPFFILDNTKIKKGIFIDCSSKIVFDLGFRQKDIINIKIFSSGCEIYLWESFDYFKIIEKYLELTGCSFLPPKWAFGYQQSRWSYKDKAEVKSLADNFRQKKIPCDAIYLDIDYMDNYKVFTINEQRFAEISGFLSELHSKGFRIMPIIDPGVKVEPDYQIYEEGRKNKYFCLNKENEEFAGYVWPGKVHFPDFYNRKVRKWWGNHVVEFMNLGFDGCWNDMNEPSIFYTDAGLDKLKEDYRNIAIDFAKWRYDNLKDKIIHLANNIDDYKSFYHLSDEGERVNHNDIHNLYGFNMIRSAYEGLEQNIPNKRFLLFSRSSYAGSQRFGGVWTGDNNSWWEHLKLNIQMVLTLNMSGLIYSGADIGGFGGNCSAELLIRWMQVGIFFPLFRNHSVINSRRQEPWLFDEETSTLIIGVIRLRYRIITYLYSEFLKSVKEKKPFVYPIFFVYKDKKFSSIDDQFFVGSSIMIAPIIEENARNRFVYLPQKFLQINNLDFKTASIMQKGAHFISSGLEDNYIYLKEDNILLVNEVMNYVGERKISHIEIVAYVNDIAEYEIFNDDGISKNAEIERILITIRKMEYDFDIKIYREGSYREIEHFTFYIFSDYQDMCKKEM